LSHSTPKVTLLVYEHLMKGEKSVETLRSKMTPR
jgi:hypothetical protein